MIKTVYPFSLLMALLPLSRTVERPYLGRQTGTVR